MPLQIRPLCMDDLDTIVEIALENFHLERQSCNALPDSPDMDYIRRQLHTIIETGTGRIAIEKGRITGFLAFEKAFPVKEGVYGATSPLFGYGVRHGCGGCENREVIIGRLFQDTAAELCRNYTQSIRVNVYAHDAKVLWMYIMTSFAMDVTEVVKDTDMPMVSSSAHGFTYREVSKKELLKYKSDIIELYRDLVNHLRVSPVFYHCRYFLPVEDRFDDFLSEDLRLFAAFEGDKLVGMIDSEPVDIAMFSNASKALCMGDVFVKPDYRGAGVAAELLRFANDELKKDGIRRLFVTHGTINPNARGFWDKYFTNYSYTMTRKIDADMLGEIQRI
ncbi:GNAT superfamily N-acetyltransferase [Anaerotaenia torta]|uniref:GNAT family N-acetyltransferase n=1 Tax=Anaerotaenia torta TaxID=433293 RepID=UPI003D20F294